MSTRQKNIVILGATLLVGASLNAAESSPVARLAHVQAESPSLGQSLLERFAYSPTYSREKLKALMDEIMKLEISDADFFGEHKDGRWIKPPMLDYAYNNAVLHDVEAAAKAGDYGKAADALLAYFKARKSEPGQIAAAEPTDDDAAGKAKVEKTKSAKPAVNKQQFTWKQGCQYNAAGALGGALVAVQNGLFKRDDVTARECVDHLKGMALLGMQLSNGYSPNDTINGLGGNMIPVRQNRAIQNLHVLPELVDSTRWRAHSFEYMTNNLKYIINDDGSYIEHTFGYPRRILPHLLGLRDEYLKYKLPVPEQYGVQVHRMSRYLMFCVLPNGRGINWGEGYEGNNRKHLAKPAQYFNDPELLWWSTLGKEGRVPGVTDVCYPQAKVCVFRSSWQEDANFLFFAPRTGGSHYQIDQNMIELYAFGRKLISDTGCRYSEPEGFPGAFNWLRAMSRSQNTMEVDEEGYRPRFERDQPGLSEGPCGITAAFSSPRAGFAEGWGGGYPTVRHERAVFFVRATGLCVVRDLLKPTDGKSHTYDQCWHFDPVNTYQSDAKACRVWTTNKDVANLDILPVDTGKLELLLRDGWFANPKVYKTVYPSFRQKTAGDAEFVTVLRPTPAGAASREIKAEPLKADKAGSYALRITTSEGTGVLIIARGSGGAEAGEVKTDADCAYVQFDAKGGVAWAVRQGGSSLTVQGKDVACEAMQGVTPPGLP